MNKKKIVVLLSTYNGEKYLQEQIDSILNQKSSHQVDLIVRDDDDINERKEKTSYIKMVYDEDL